MLGWDWYGFDKKCTETRYAEHVFLHLVGSAGHVVPSGASGTRTTMHYFYAWVGPIWIRQKNALGHVRQTCGFASFGICWLRSAFGSFRGVKH
jgi:hypothetical protein